MHKVTFFPLGNADTTLITLANGKDILFDFANMASATDPAEKRAKLDTELRNHMAAKKKDGFDIVAFSHGDDDHTRGAGDFFHFDRFKERQGGQRLKIREMWVPAAMIVERGTEGDALIVRQEARYRLRHGYGIRVFSRPDHLREWLESEGLSLESRGHLITDAGQIVPGLTLQNDGVEFFAHSPFAHRQNEVVVIDRNENCLVMQATFSVSGTLTRLLMLADIMAEPLDLLIRITRAKNRAERLWWDICKLPHHCSAYSLSTEKGRRQTVPTDDIDWLYGNRGNGAILVSSSDPIPAGETTQPPHFQAANYYRDKLDEIVRGKFLVTMSEPTESRPRKIEIEIGIGGAKHLLTSALGGAALTDRSGPRVG